MLVTRHVDIPEALMLAQERARLVLFVGAGASVAPPSGLPQFPALAQAIAEETNSPFTKADLDDPSRFLDRLDGRGVSVHRLAHARVSRSAEPNDVHKVLIDLFPSFDAVRIVTTNWDRHLTTAATAKFGRRPAVYAAPALPLGRDFSGIVHLHGSLDQRPEDLIITEGDFGRAYLTDAYCARFVYEMFRSYTVLFIGYSHKDVIMYHLGRGLPVRAEPRYGLISDAPPEEWRALGITPIVYPSDDNHAALGEGLSAWAWLIQSGHLLYERCVMKLLASATMPRSGEIESLAIAWDPADESFMQRVVSDPERVGLFTEHAEGDPRLLEWVKATPPFQELFAAAAPLTPAGRAVGFWFADRFAAHEPDAALAIVHQQRRNLNPDAADLVAAALARHHAAPRTIARWLPVLLTSPTGVFALGLLFDALCDDDGLDVGILLLDHLVAPRPTLRTTLASGGGFGTGIDVVVTGGDYQLRHAWSRYFSPRIEMTASALVPMMEKHLRAAHLFLRSHGGAGLGRDMDSFRRASIGTESQNQPMGGIDLLIDIARDALTALGRGSGNRAQAVTDSWANSEIPMLRRLAVHCHAHRDDIPPDARITWLLGTGMLYDLLARPEVYDLLAALIADASDAREQLLTAVLDGPGPSAAPEHRHLPVMSLLEWLIRHAPDFTEAAQALAQLQQEHPEFAADQHPNRIFTFTTMWGTERSPRTVEQLRLMQTPEEIDWMREYQGGPDFQGPTRLGLLWEIQRAAAADTAWSLALAGRLASIDDWDSDLWPTIIQAWTQALPSVTTEDLVAMLDLLNAASYPALFTHTARLLTTITDQQGIATQVVDRCDELATAMWTVARDHDGAGLPALEDPEDQLFVWAAVEHWIGHLTTTSIQIAAHRWRADRDAWAGLPPGLRERLEQLLTVTFTDRTGVLAVAARSLALLCALDQPWTTEHIVPGFDWNRQDDPDRRRAAAAWQGFLTHAAWNERVLGLLDPFFADAFTGMTDDMRKAVVDVVANIAVGAPTHDELTERLVSVFTSTATDDERREWARSVGWLLGRISAEDAEAAWGTWILDYWRRRQEGTPRSLSPSEIQEMLTWIPSAGHHFPAAVDLMTSAQGEVEFGSAYLLLHDLPGHKLLTDHPLEASKLVAFVLARCHEPSPLCAEIGAVITTLTQTRTPGASAYLAQACDHARGLGCTRATEWIADVQDGESS